MKIILLSLLFIFVITGFYGAYADSSVNLEASQDSFIRKGTSNINEGANWNIIVKAGGDNKGLVSFDMTGLSGPIDSATLELFIVNNGDKVDAGSAISKVQRETTKTKDITGGLPRVAELFEARKPKEVAVISEIDGVVSFVKTRREKEKLFPCMVLCLANQNTSKNTQSLGQE